ncbi:hypothetical protein [Streptomyces californicus]|uniref:hypothetical protein n=1 Tax=Streptomyces californicus TaxID=67351 RepID=UPI0037B5602E
MIRRRVPALVLGGVWWWAVLRLILRPEQAGLIEGAVAAGGWGLSLLPVHVASVVPVPVGSPGHRRWLTTAWRRRRSGGGSGRS